MSVPMDWMYKRPTVDTEAYLLGKPIDRSLEQLQNPDGCPTSNEDIGGKPGALFVEAAASAALEAEAKLREDPLYAIRKKEEEQRRMLLNNPVRLKKMQEELERQKLKDEKKSKSSNDKDILAKMLKLKAKYGTDLKDILSEDVGSSSSRSHHRNRDQHRNRDRNRDRHHERRSRSRSHSEERKRSSPSSSHRNSNRQTDASSANRSDRSVKSEQSERFGRRSALPAKRPRFAATSAKYDPAELERKRLEMMLDAKERDSERAKNLSEYKRKEEADKEHDKKLATGTSGGFIRPMLESAAQGSTLESRISASRNKNQRTRADLDKKFTER